MAQLRASEIFRTFAKERPEKLTLKVTEEMRMTPRLLEELR